MTDTKKSVSVRPGIPMSEEGLREWKKTFSDIQESIDNLSADNDTDDLTEENGEQHSGRVGRQIRKNNC